MDQDADILSTFAIAYGHFMSWLNQNLNHISKMLAG